MTNSKIASELIRIAKELIAERTYWDIGPETRRDAANTLKKECGLQGNEVNAMPVWSQMLTNVSVEDKDAGIPHHNKFHYFAVYKKGDKFIGGNAWGGIGSKSKAIVIAAGDKDSVMRAVQGKAARKISGRDYVPVRVPTASVKR